MKLRYIVFNFLIFLIVFPSCKDKVEGAISGWWTIDTIYYKEYDIKICLNGNSIKFDFDDQSNFPLSSKYCKIPFLKTDAEWGDIEVINLNNSKDTIPLRLKISVNNEIFTGTHKIRFHKDEINKLLKMEIWSDGLYLICRKALFNFDKNILLINQLEEISWPEHKK